VIKLKKRSNIKTATPTQALDELIKGNKKYTSPWNFLAKRKRELVATIQKPFAIVLSCSDSRVPTEIIFNQLGVGSLFIIRNAGNVIDGVALGSVEYGIEQLDALLIIVLGHERCGAVTATVETILEHQSESPDVMYPGHIKDIICAITPAVHAALQKSDISKTISTTIKDQIISDSIKENIHLVVSNIYKNSEIISSAIDSEKIKIVGAYYDLDVGSVKIIT